MSIKKSLAFAVSIFLMASGLDAAAAANPVQNLTKLLTAVNPNNYQSSVAVAARAEFIKLTPRQLGQILQAREFDALFVTPYGFSLIHGWMLNKFTPHDLLFYINQNFSFSKYIRNLIAVMPVGVQANISEKWGSARRAIEANRWAYYQHMQYIPAAIAQAGTVAGTINDAMPAIIKSAYILALPKEALKDHMKSIIAAGIPVDAPQAKAKFESIMILLLNQYNINSLLPAGHEISDIQKFVEFVVEHVKELYKIPGADAADAAAVLGNVNALNAEQTGERLRCFVNELMRVGAPVVASGAVKPVNTAFTATVQAAIEIVRQHKVTPSAVDKIVVPEEILPVYAEAVTSIAAGGAPATPATPLKSPGKTSKSGVLSPLPKGMKHIAGGAFGLTEFQSRGVYETILMNQLDAPFVTLSFYDITDILKFFASYLDKVKGSGDNNYSNKGPSTGNTIPGKTYLSEVLTMRYRILAGDRSAERNVALLFLNKCRQDIMNSMVKRGMVIKDPSAAGGSVVRNLFGPN
jgi:hypothetical protein